jgi:hypothetical protein
MENTTQPPQELINNSFLRTLNNINAGQSVTDLSEELSKVVAAVKLTGKPGSLSYKITIKPASQRGIMKLEIEDDIASKIPKAGRERVFFFASEDNLLTRDDPRQMNLSLKVIAERRAEVLKEIEDKPLNEAAS